MWSTEYGYHAFVNDFRTILEVGVVNGIGCDFFASDSTDGGDRIKGSFTRNANDSNSPTRSSGKCANG